MKQEDKKKLEELDILEERKKYLEDLLTYVHVNGEPYFHIDYLKKILKLDEDK